MTRHSFRVGDVVRSKAGGEAMAVIDVGDYSLSILDPVQPCALCRRGDGGPGLPRVEWFYCRDLVHAREGV